VGSARALSERSEDIPHRTHDRAEGFRPSLATAGKKSQSDRAEGFLPSLVTAVKESQSDRAEGFPLSSFLTR